ncbi:MAG: hypothetical protein OHK0046_15400 [Anaerolineae bacterium]
MRRFLLLLMVLWVIPAVFAQEEDQVTDSTIFLNAPVQETLTERSFFDRWRFRAEAGDVYLITMTAMDGLAPLVGVAETDGTIIARSDERADGEALPDALPNDTITLEFTAPESGEYSIVATRVGNQQGTTTGSYVLMLALLDNIRNPDDPRQDVTFRCGENVITTALTFRFTGQAEVDTYRMSVYGLDGFDPYIRVSAGFDRELSDCGDDSQTMGGDTIILPGEDPVTFPADTPEDAARLSLRGGDLLGRVVVNIGSVEGVAGRYLLVIDGFILPPQAEQYLELQLGPLAQQTALLVYMADVGRTRLDPLVTWSTPEDDEDDLFCDDAGLGSCADVPTFTGAGVELSEGLTIVGDRFDAGLRLSPGNTEPMVLGFRSRAENASGGYAIFLIGELPPR